MLKGADNGRKESDHTQNGQHLVVLRKGFRERNKEKQNVKKKRDKKEKDRRIELASALFFCFETSFVCPVHPKISSSKKSTRHAGRK